MKKLNLVGITEGLETIKNIVDESSGIGWDGLIEADLIDYAEKNSYASEDTDESIRELAEQIEVVGLLHPLGVIKNGSRYTLFSGERRYRAITQYLKWSKIPCRVFENLSPNKAQLMLHIANGSREYSPAKKLELYEEYHGLLQQMKAAGEFTGPLQEGIANLLNVSSRQVRTYRMMAEQLTPQEKEGIKSGTLPFSDAKATASTRAEVEAKSGTSSGSNAGLQPYRFPTPLEGRKQENDVDAEKDESGTSSAFMVTPEMRTALLIKAVKHIWEPKKLRDSYLREMPTPQEAIKNIIRPQNGYRAASLNVSAEENEILFYTCTNQTLQLQLGNSQNIVYKYAEVDRMIRQLYRGGQLGEERLN